MFNYNQLPISDVAFYPVISIEELPQGQQIFFSIGEASIVLVNTTDGLFAIADVCSHDNGPVGEGEITGTEIKCPRHGARFDLTSGKALSMPAHVDIPAYPVRIVDGMIEVGIPTSA